MKAIPPQPALGEAERRRRAVQHSVFLHIERQITFAQYLVDRTAGPVHVRLDGILWAREIYGRVRASLERHSLDAGQLWRARGELERLRARIETLESTPPLSVQVPDSPPTAPAGSMDRAMIVDHFTETQNAIAECERQLEHQHGVIEKLRTGGYDTRMAEQILRTFEATHALQLAELELARDKLAGAG